MSCVAVDVDGARSEVFKISEGMKQGGVLALFCSISLWMHS